MPATPSSDRPITGGGVDEPHDDHPEETARVTLGFYLRSRYWGRILLLSAMIAIGLGVIDAIVPILNWQLALIALCLAVVSAVYTREQLLFALAVQLPAAGVQLMMFLDRPDDQRSMILWFSLSLCVFTLYLLISRRPRRVPRRVMVNFPDGRQIPLLAGQPRCAEARHWEACSVNGPIYLTDGWKISHAGSRRTVVEPVIHHDEQGRAYIPDLNGLRDTL